MIHHPIQLYCKNASKLTLVIIQYQATPECFPIRLMNDCSLCFSLLLTYLDLSLVGHGQSEGERVYVDTVNTYVQDAINHISAMKEKYPHVPCFIMGQSMVSYVGALQL